MYKQVFKAVAQANTALWLIFALLVHGAAAQESGENALVIEEVVVTAQKREESVQDIPSTVNAVSGEALEEFNVLNFNDVEQLTPGLSLSNLDPRNSSISLRGVSFDPDSAASPAVETYWNDMAVRSNVAFNQLFDMGRIEVLRGPQGTLQGRTSPGGAIMLHTRPPSTTEGEGQIQQTIADKDTINTQVALNVPLIDNVLGVRIAGVYNATDLEEIVNINTGTKQSSDTKAGRLSVKWQTDRSDVTVVHEYLERFTDGFEDVFGSDINGQGNPTLGAFDRIALTEFDNRIEQRNKITTLTGNLDIGAHQLTSVSGYQKNVNQSYRDIDKGNVLPNFVQLAIVDSDFDIFTQELRFASTEPSFWEYMVGGYYEKSDSQTLNFNTGPSVTSTDPATALASFDGSFRNTTVDIPNNREIFGLFSHHKLNFESGTTLQLGLRWQKVRALRRADLSLLINGEPIPLFGLIDEEQTRTSTTAVTGSLKISHYFGDDLMLYAAYDRGFRPGGITITPTPLDESLLLYNEETSDALEIGIKSSLWGGRAQFNASVFYQQFDGFIARQTDLFSDIDGNGTTDTAVRGGVVFNGDSIIRGVETEFTALLSENWSAFIGASYTDSKFDNAAIPCTINPAPGGPVAAGEQVARCVTNSRTGNEPNLSISANTEYAIPLETIELFARGLFKYSGARPNDSVLNADVAGYATTNLYLGARDYSGAWEVSIWAKNLFDKQARSAQGGEDLVTAQRGATAVPLPSGYVPARLIPERSVGLTARYNFGF